MFKGGKRLWASARLFTATDSADPTTEKYLPKPNPERKKERMPCISSTVAFDNGDEEEVS